jgi:hypothetical protein
MDVEVISHFAALRNSLNPAGNRSARKSAELREGGMGSDVFELKQILILFFQSR